jgi:hypothetical protein
VALVELVLTSTVDGVTNRMLQHPLRVVWQVTMPDGKGRTTETDGMRLVQYFDLPTDVTVFAALRWHEEIKVPTAFPLRVSENPDYGKRQLLGGGLEWAVLAIAIVFAIATAMSAVYDATFGSFSQYLALFVWAAGAGSGGNAFKQLGATSTPGGQSDNVLQVH